MEIDSGMREYLRSLQASIENQEATIEALRAKNKRLEEQLKTEESKVEDLTKQAAELEEQLEAKNTDNEALTKQISELKERLEATNTDTKISITDEITKAAEEVVNEQFLQGLAYEETTGLYYDYKSGYYYDATKRKFYDGEKGVYLDYDSQTGKYHPENKDDSSSISSSRSASPCTPPEREEEEKPPLPPEKPPRELSEEGEVSSPSPPPPPTNHKKKNKKKRVVNEWDDKKLRKKLKKEMKIPCIRMVVHSSPSDTVNVGTLFIVTCKGGTIGREGNHDVLIEDIACSKNHGKIEFDERQCKYYLTDEGSRNGTFVDGKRLHSRPQEIGHGSLLKIGSVELICHVHPGQETCLKCEPGVIISSQPKMTNNAVNENRESKRKSELKQLRKKYGIGGSAGQEDGAAADISKSGYVDRACDRRKTKGMCF